VAQFGSALDWGSSGRRFKSCQPDTEKYQLVSYTPGHNSDSLFFYVPGGIPCRVGYGSEYGGLMRCVRDISARVGESGRL
jgi:hypothetical protein